MRLLRADILLASVMFQILMMKKSALFFARYCSFILITHSNYHALQHAILYAHTLPKAIRIFKMQDSSARHIVYITKIEWTS